MAPTFRRGRDRTFDSLLSSDRRRDSARRRRTVALTLLLLVVGAIAFTLASAWRALGREPAGERLSRVVASPRWDGEAFVNPQPIHSDMWEAVRRGSSHATPETPLPVVSGDGERFAAPPESGLRVTWMGHSSLLVELDGHRVLVDPHFGPRASPLAWAGPKRWYPPPIPLEALPEADVVLLSHDHYDHLDLPTVEALSAAGARFIVPLGVGAHLAYWGVPTERILELDWWGTARVGELEVVLTPARHASGRHLFDRNATLWGGFALLGPEHRVYYSGDTGLFEGMREIGARLGPFDLTMIEIGAYDRAWPDWHLGPEQAVLAHQWVRGEAMLPVHWGLFNLALHGWTEPAERVLQAADEAGVTLHIPRPGESVEPSAASEEPPADRASQGGAVDAPSRWWPDLPWTPASDDPIVASAVDRSLPPLEPDSPTEPESPGEPESPLGPVEPTDAQ